MVSAWLYDDCSSDDPREPHRLADVSRAVLERIGVVCRSFDPQSQLNLVDEFAAARNYVSRDVISISKEKLPNYDEKIKSFFTEHIHDDEEIRYILDGSGYFDVRDENDKWIRIHTVKGDLIVLPAGIYHRFILDSGNSIQAMRLFKEDPKWTPINRSEETDKHPRRVEYIESIAPGETNK